MKDDNLEAVLDNMKYVGRGGYNVALRTENYFTLEGHYARWVLKKPQTRDSQGDLLDEDDIKLNSVKRAVRKWKLLNPHLPVLTLSDGWLVPDCGDLPANDAEISDKLCEIYRSKRVIIDDACGNNNFLNYEGTIVCVDVDHAFRRGSIVSESFLDSVRYEQRLDAYLKAYKDQRGMSESTATIRGLRYLEDYLTEDEIHDKYIFPPVVLKVGQFSHSKKPLTLEILNFFFQISELFADDDIPYTLFNYSVVNFMLEASRRGTLSKELILKSIHDYFCDYCRAMRVDDTLLLQAMTFIIKNAPSLLNVLSQEGYSLLHTAVLTGSSQSVDLLLKSGADLLLTASPRLEDVKHFFPGMNALDMAICLRNHPISKMLEEKGAVVSPVLEEIIREQLPCQDLTTITDVFIVFYEYLEALARGESELSEDQKIVLIRLLFKFPYLLSIDLDRSGNTFLHLVFSKDPSAFFSRYAECGPWNLYSRLINSNTKNTLLHQVCSATYDVDVRVMYCKLLIEWGAPLHVKNAMGKTAHDVWRGGRHKNPFVQLAAELLALSSGALEKSRESELLALIKKNTLLLIWPIDEDKNTLLHYIFSQDNTKLISEVISLPDWDDMALTTNKKAGFLFTAIARVGNDTYYDLFKKIPIPKRDLDRVLLAASKGGNVNFCKRLLADGANPNRRNPRRKNAEELWSGESVLNPIRELRRELIDLAHNTDTIDAARKNQLLMLLKTHRDLLTWPLDGEDYTFLHLAFASNNEEALNTLLPCLNPEALENLMTGNEWRFFYIIAKEGHLTYYCTLQHCANEREVALRIASEHGRVDFCMRLLWDGANPTIKGARGKNAEELWPAELIDNPFVSFRNEIIFVASATMMPCTTCQEDLLALIRKHEYVLTWPLDQEKNTFFHLAFKTRNYDLINALVDYLSKPEITHIENLQQQDLFILLADLGEITYYPILANHHKNWENALMAATIRGHETYCKLLLRDFCEGYIPILHEQKWLQSHGETNNPFIPYTRDYHLKKDKKEEQGRTPLMSLGVFAPGRSATLPGMVILKKYYYI